MRPKNEAFYGQCLLYTDHKQYPLPQVDFTRGFSLQGSHPYQSSLGYIHMYDCFCSIGLLTEPQIERMDGVITRVLPDEVSCINFYYYYSFFFISFIFALQPWHFHF